MRNAHATLFAVLRHVQRYNRNPYMRNKAVAAFVDHCIKKDSPDAWSVFRLALPASDSRTFAGLTQHRMVYLVTIVVKSLVRQYPRLATAVAQDGDGDFYSRLFSWRDKDDLAVALGEPSELSELLKEKVFDVFCGDLSMSETERDLAVRMNDKRMWSPTVAEMNVKLDELSDACSRRCVEEQVDILAWFMRRLTSNQMMWLVQIVLKRTRIWIKERDVLEQAPWGEAAVVKFFEQGVSFERLLGGVAGVTHIATDIATGAVVNPYRANEPAEGQPTVQPEARPVRQAQVVMGSIDDAFMYMERRFKPGNYQPMVVIADASFDGIKVRVRRVGDACSVEYSDDEKKRGSPACEDTVLLDAVAKMVPGADFEMEADVVAWNTHKQCAEPRFILDALMDADRRLEDSARISCESQPAHVALRDHLELLVLVTDVLSFNGESMLGQYLWTRVENLQYFEAKAWGPEVGFRVPVRVAPLLPGSTQIGGALISTVMNSREDIKAFRDSMERLGANAVTLRAPEAEWNTVEKMARVQVRNSFGMSIINCVVMGYWRETRQDHEGAEPAEARVSHWLLGVANDSGSVHTDLGSQRNDQAFDDTAKPLIKLRNHLHITDERATLARLEAGSTLTPTRDASTGMYVCHTDVGSTRLETPAPHRSALLLVAGSLLGPGKWSSTPLVLAPSLLGLSPPGSTVASITDICAMVDAKRAQSSREKIPSIRFREKKVAERFCPCGTRPPRRVRVVDGKDNAGNADNADNADNATTGILKDTVAYFVNHTADPVNAPARHEAKRRYEDLVDALGGSVSQNYYEGVDVVAAGQPTVFTHALRNKNVGVVSLSWLDKLAALDPPPAEIPRILADDYLPDWCVFVCRIGVASRDRSRTRALARSLQEPFRGPPPQKSPPGLPRPVHHVWR